MVKNLSVFPVERSEGYIIRLLHRELSLGLKRTFLDHGFDITPEQWGVLNKLWEADGLHQSKLAIRVYKDRHNMTRIINILEKNEYIVRRPDKTDKRLLLVFLTARGKALKKKLIPIAKAYLSTAFSGFTDDELSALQQMHLRILSNIGISM